MKYVGQIGRTFRLGFQEHLRDFKYGNGKSRFAQHLIDNGHIIEQMEDFMDTLHITRKGQILHLPRN